MATVDTRSAGGCQTSTIQESADDLAIRALHESAVLKAT